MKIHYYPGFDRDKFLCTNDHLRVVKAHLSCMDVVEVGSTAEVEAAADEVRIEGLPARQKMYGKGWTGKVPVKKRKPRCNICQSRVAMADGRCNHRDCVPF